MIEREEVIGRLQDGNRGLQIPSDSRRDHVDAMEDLLASLERANEVGESRRFMLQVPLRNAAVLLVAFGLGVAAAAYSDGVPGDPFYRAKRVAEQPAQIVDRDLVANNRLGELGELIDRGADPDTVLAARTEAARALSGGQSDDTTERALSLLAWPGGLDGRGVDADVTNEGLVLSESEWFNERAYTASLADGYLVTISALDGEILIGTTGDWTVFTTGTGWRLTNDDVDQVYFIQRQGTDLRVNSMAADAGASPSSGREEAAGAIGRSSGATDRSRFGDPIATPTDPGGLTPVTPGPSATSRTVATSGVGNNPSTTQRTGSPSTPTAVTAGPSPTATSSTQITSSPTTARPTTSAVQNTTVPQTTTTRRTTTTVQATTTVPQAVNWNFYLENPGSGNTSSSRNLPLSAGSAPTGSLRNFDRDRDDEPGLLIKKDGDGLSVSDNTKHQEWTWTSSGSTVFRGEAMLSIWLAAKDFEDDDRIGLLASLELCNPGCSRLGTGQWSGSAPEDTFRNATVSFGQINETVPAGATLRLKIVVPDDIAETDVMFAYDSASYPSRLSIG